MPTLRAPYSSMNGSPSNICNCPRRGLPTLLATLWIHREACPGLGLTFSYPCSSKRGGLATSIPGKGLETVTQFDGPSPVDHVLAHTFGKDFGSLLFLSGWYVGRVEQIKCLYPSQKLGPFLFRPDLGMETSEQKKFKLQNIIKFSYSIYGYGFVHLLMRAKEWRLRCKGNRRKKTYYILVSLVLHSFIQGIIWRETVNVECLNDTRTKDRMASHENQCNLFIGIGGVGLDSTGSNGHGHQVGYNGQRRQVNSRIMRKKCEFEKNMVISEGTKVQKFLRCLIDEGIRRKINSIRKSEMGIEGSEDKNKESMKYLCQNKNNQMAVPNENTDDIRVGKTENNEESYYKCKNRPGEVVWEVFGCNWLDLPP